MRSLFPAAEAPASHTRVRNLFLFAREVCANPLGHHRAVRNASLFAGSLVARAQPYEPLNQKASSRIASKKDGNAPRPAPSRAFASGGAPSGSTRSPWSRQTGQA